MDTVAPECTVQVSTNQVIDISWMTPGILKCSKKQLLLYRKALNTGLTIDLEKIQKLSKYIRKSKTGL